MPKDQTYLAASLGGPDLLTVADGGLHRYSALRRQRLYSHRGSSDPGIAPGISPGAGRTSGGPLPPAANVIKEEEEEEVEEEEEGEEVGEPQPKPKEDSACSARAQSQPQTYARDSNAIPRSVAPELPKSPL
ncbi:unnamed protein product [Arctogadus glacialis]